jgi:hypothetical protein
MSLLFFSIWLLHTWKLSPHFERDKRSYLISQNFPSTLSGCFSKKDFLEQEQENIASGVLQPQPSLGARER